MYREEIECLNGTGGSRKSEKMCKMIQEVDGQKCKGQLKM
jgi:hypothetical protein